MQKKLEYKSRKFLNKEGLAAFQVYVSECDYIKGWYDAHVSLTDHDSKVVLDLSVYTAKDLDVQMAKLQLLIKELTKMHDLFEENYIAIKAGFPVESNKVKQKLKVAPDEL